MEEKDLVNNVFQSKNEAKIFHSRNNSSINIENFRKLRENRTLNIRKLKVIKIQMIYIL